MRFILSCETKEYKSIVTKFNEAMTGKYTEILSIERIQNETWYMQYLTHNLAFKARLSMDTEQRLYHGSTKEAADDIVKSWFNRSFAGVNGTYSVFFVFYHRIVVLFRNCIWGWCLFFIKCGLQSWLYTPK
jgi:hypothetical protein